MRIELSSSRCQRRFFSLFCEIHLPLVSLIKILHKCHRSIDQQQQKAKEIGGFKPPNILEQWGHWQNKQNEKLLFFFIHSFRCNRSWFWNCIGCSMCQMCKIHLISFACKMFAIRDRLRSCNCGSNCGDVNLKSFFFHFLHSVHSFLSFVCATEGFYLSLIYTNYKLIYCHFILAIFPVSHLPLTWAHSVSLSLIQMTFNLLRKWILNKTC